MSNQSEQLRRRDNFAALAMQAIITNRKNASCKEIADAAVQQADALIKALNNHP